MASSNTYCISPGRYQAYPSGIRNHPWGHSSHHQCKSCHFCFESGCITSTHSGTLQPYPALWLGWFIDYAKAFDCVDHNKLWEILKEIRIPDHLTCLLRNLYAGQEATVRTGHGTTDWFQIIGKGVRQGCILSPCWFNFYAEYIMRNAGLEEAQAGIKISRRNINNLRYTDDTTLMAESEELKSLLMKVKEKSEKVGLKLSIQKTKIMASGPITSWQIDGETVEIVSDFIFLGSKITANGDCSHEIKRHLLLRRKVMTNLDAY